MSDANDLSALERELGQLEGAVEHRIRTEWWLFLQRERLADQRREQVEQLERIALQLASVHPLAWRDCSCGECALLRRAHALKLRLRPKQKRVIPLRLGVAQDATEYCVECALCEHSDVVGYHEVARAIERDCCSIPKAAASTRLNASVLLSRPRGVA